MSSTFNNESALPYLGALPPELASLDDPELAQVLREHQALKEQIATQTQFMHLLTHQLATPLTSLSGSVQLLAEPDLAHEQRQEFLEVVQQQVNRLQYLLQDLMALRNIETGALETQAGNFSVALLIKELVANYCPYQVDYQVSADLPAVWGDRWQVSQVLVNLLSNAIKYSPHHHTIEIGATLLPNGWVKVWVRDQGLGIPAADQPHLFERFYRVKHQDRQEIEGTGLGLSLCKLLVENQGGTLGFESVHGKGSCFYFTLPTADLANR